MYTKNTRLTVGFTFFLFFVWVSSAVAEKPLVYQNRGNRYEGIKWKPVSGYDIELISAYVDHISGMNYLPKQLKVKFYLKQPSEVHLTVRELDYKYYYWMDKVTRACRPSGQTWASPKTLVR